MSSDKAHGGNSVLDLIGFPGDRGPDLCFVFTPYCCSDTVHAVMWEVRSVVEVELFRYL
jgi:hypothetical protein